MEVRGLESEPFDDRELGTLKVKRAPHVSVDDMLNVNEDELDGLGRAWEKKKTKNQVILEEDEESVVDEFESSQSVRNLSIEVSDQLIERTATALSTNEMIVGRHRSQEGKMGSIGTVRRLAMDKSV